MAKEGKKGFGRIVLIVVIVVVVAGVFGAMGGGGSTDSSADMGAQTEEQTSTPVPDQDPYTVSDESIDASNPYSLFIDGTLTNNTDREVTYIQVEYNLYDAEGAQVGTALANTNNLQPGGVWKFEAIGTASPDEVASFELIDVTGF